MARALDWQFDALHRTGIAEDCLYSDTASCKDAEPKELAACLKALREGDIQFVWRVGRSLPDLVRIVGELERKGIGF